MKTRMPMMRYNFAHSGLILLLVAAVFVILPALTTQAANFVVDDTSDGGPQSSHCTDAISGNCSLRDAIQAANDNGSNVDTITFNVLANSTIVLTQGRFTLNHPVTINGPNTASNDVIIDGNGQQLFFINISTGWTIITDLTLKNGGGGNGGVIHVPNNKNLRLERCTISDTTQTGNSLGLAIFVQTGATFIMNQCTVTRISGALNQQTHGAIYIQQGATTIITNSTISGNQAQQGSAIYNRGGDLTLTHCTITNNTGQGTASKPNTGAALMTGPETLGGSATITNTLIVGNTNNSSGDTDCYKESGSSSVTTTQSVMDSHGSCGSPATAPNLVLCALQDNEGPTLTHKVCADPDGDVIDAAGNCTSLTTIDQRGITRPQDDDGDGTPECDIGAVEGPGASPPGACPGPKPTPPPVALSKGDLGSHTFPTYLFVASYDWLHHFYDRNARGARGSNHQTDPDTDNFNKVIVLDSNLFPIMTAVVGDHEFPNITSRNTLTWMTGSASSYTPSVNDYFNRGIAVAPDYITKQPVKYSVLSSACESGNWVIVPTYREMNQYGARSMMQWTFVTDPGNNNIRRYEFEKLVEFFEMIDAEGNITGTIAASPQDLSMDDVCSGGSAPPEIEDKWGKGNTEKVLINGVGNKCPGLVSTDLPGGTCTGDNCYDNDQVLWTCKHSNDQVNDIAELVTYINNGQTLGTYPYLEFILTIPERVTFPYTLDLDVYGNGRDASSSNLIMGINTHTGTVNINQFHGGTTGFPSTLYDYRTIQSCGARDHGNYSFTINTSDDQDAGTPGVQIVVRLYSTKHGGFVVDEIRIGEQDSAFTVKYDGSQSLREARWNVITSFLETIPPESYPGYHSYTSSVNRTLGYGYRTNTSFTTAKYVRFSDPRDIAVYRDMFDLQNNGPTYIFVADTGNSRIQVFMNATGSAGKTNAKFPIRPVPVKGPNVSDFNTNELAMRPSGGGYGHGRKADWRHYTTVSGDTLANSRIPANAGRGEFYYPHGVAVDQDPDTRDVYLFVADTFNHRIQIFRDTTGVTNQPITDKRFDFKYEEGWGTYPLQTTMTMTPPGPFHFRFPKGIDVARFSNNSSYLYVVDAKDYRVMKYLISEGSASEGIQSIDAVAGYGHDGTNFVGNLTTIQGVPMTASNTTPGFLNPQDVATGYNGFYLYSAPNTGGYHHEASLNGQTVGVRYLDNHMFYVTDYARNNTSITPNWLNMRVMQFFDHPQRPINGLSLPWESAAVSFDKGELGQSALSIFYGVYSSDGWLSIPQNVIAGSTENVPGKQSFFTDRPVGIATLTWNTVIPFDIRVVDLGNRVIYPNGTTIDNDTLLRVGVHSRAFFGLPYTNISSYTNFTSTDYAWDGKRTHRIHVFCYDTNGAFQNHTALLGPPFEFTPGNNPPNCPAGYMKIIAEEDLFEYSGKSGTQIFRVID